MDRMMGRKEVAGQIDVSPTTLRTMVNEKAFPPPVRLGKSEDTDKWPESVVREWLRQKKREIYKAGGAAMSNQSGGQLFFAIGDVGDECGCSARQVFSVLIAEGLLEDSDDEQIRYRPTEQGFERGFFWRVEKYLFREKKTYLQTVVPARAWDEVVDLVRKALAKTSGRRK